MRIAVIGAMPEEIALLVSTLGLEKVVHTTDFDFYEGQHQAFEIVLLKSGIGKVSSAISTAMLIRDFSPDYIINIGSAGAACANLKLGDVVVSTQALYHDADATTWGYELGQVPNQPVHFKPDESLLDVAKKLQGDDVHFGQIVSGDAFVSDEQQLAKIKNTFPDAIALDMESAAIAQTCHQLGTPFLICRAISDNGDDDATDTHTDNLQFSSERSAKFALRLLKALETAEITLKEAK